MAIVDIDAGAVVRKGMQEILQRLDDAEQLAHLVIVDLDRPDRPEYPLARSRAEDLANRILGGDS